MSTKTRVRETRHLAPAGRELKGQTLTRVLEIDDDPKESQVPVAASTPLSDWKEEEK